MSASNPSTNRQREASQADRWSSTPAFLAICCRESRRSVGAEMKLSVTPCSDRLRPCQAAGNHHQRKRTISTIQYSVCTYDPALVPLYWVRRQRLCPRQSVLQVSFYPSSFPFGESCCLRELRTSMASPYASWRSFNCFSYCSRTSSGLARRALSIPALPWVTQSSISEGGRSNCRLASATVV